MVRTSEYLRLSEVLMDEMKMVGDQRRDLRHMVRTIPLKQLHKQAKVEVIILCLCIYVRKTYNTRSFRWQEYGVVKKYGLTCSDVLTVVTNLCIYYARKVPLPMSPDIDKHGSVDESYFNPE